MNVPGVRAAEPDLTIVSDATYDVQPVQHRVRVSLTLVLTNHLKDTVTKRYYFDRAFLAGLPRVRIVHGSGMGILRKALRDYLRTHPHVATVSEPQQNEGGAGATVVELRS